MLSLAAVVLAALVATSLAGGATSSGENGLVSFWSDRAGLPGVWVMKPDGSSPRLLTGTGSRAKRGSFSPDGRWMALDGQPARGETFAFDVQLIGVDGRGRRHLTFGPTRDTEARWAPDGKSIVFQRKTGEFGPPWIWTVRTDGTGLRRIVAGSSPSWSPDGSTLLLARDVGGQSEIFLLRGDRLTRLRGTPDDEFPAGFSPDGRWILFTRVWKSRPQADVEVMRVDGSGRRRLTRTPGLHHAAAWAPDGRLVLFTTVVDRRYSQRGQVFVMGADGSRPRNISRNPRADDYATSWQRLPG